MGSAGGGGGGVASVLWRWSGLNGDDGDELYGGGEVVFEERQAGGEACGGRRAIGAEVLCSRRLQTNVFKGVVWMRETG